MDFVNDLDWDSGEDAFPHERLNLTGDSRTEARLCVVQVLFAARAMGQDVRDAGAAFRGRLNVRKADKKLFDLLVDELGGGIDRYEAMVQAHLLDSWTMERIDPVLLALLMTAFAELAAHEAAPKAVIINEYVNISKGFAAPEDVAFVNKMLDVVGAKIRG